MVLPDNSQRGGERGCWYRDNNHGEMNMSETARTVLMSCAYAGIAVTVLAMLWILLRKPKTYRGNSITRPQR